MTFKDAVTYFALTLFFISSCSKTQEQNKEAGLENILIDTDKVKDSVDISPWIKDIKLIRLEEKEGNFLGQIKKVLVTSAHYIVMDKYDTRQILLYNKNGDFVKSLIDHGDGPLELMQLNDGWLNEKRNLEVYDYSQKR